MNLIQSNNSTESRGNESTFFSTYFFTLRLFLILSSQDKVLQEESMLRMWKVYILLGYSQPKNYFTLAWFELNHIELNKCPRLHQEFCACTLGGIVVSNGEEKRIFLHKFVVIFDIFMRIVSKMNKNYDMYERPFSDIWLFEYMMILCGVTTYDL